MPALIPAPIPGRPLYVLYEGGRLDVWAHERYHVETVRAFKRKIRAAHPDVNHRCWATGHTWQLLHKRARWEQSEGAGTRSSAWIPRREERPAQRLVRP